MMGRLPCPSCPRDAPPVTVRIVWEHARKGCWCESTSNPRRHVSGACDEHVAKEVVEIESFGCRVLLLENLGELVDER